MKELRHGPDLGLTGRAFREIGSQHELLEAVWLGQLNIWRHRGLGVGVYREVEPSQLRTVSRKMDERLHWKEVCVPGLYRPQAEEFEVWPALRDGLNIGIAASRSPAECEGDRLHVG